MGSDPHAKDTKFINCRMWPFWRAVWLVIWAVRKRIFPLLAGSRDDYQVSSAGGGGDALHLFHSAKGKGDSHQRKENETKGKGDCHEWHSVKPNTLGLKVLRTKTPARLPMINNMISISLDGKPCVSEAYSVLFISNSIHLILVRVERKSLIRKTLILIRVPFETATKSGEYSARKG